MNSMHSLRNSGALTVALGLIAGVAITAAQGCGENGGPLGDLAEQCGLTCAAEGFAEGNASISGIASIDSFFGAAIDLNANMRGLSGSIRAELDAIAVSVGLEPGASGADISAAVQAYIDANVEGGLTIEFQEPRCEANVEASVSAAAECDVEVDPGMVSVKCEGSCKAEAGVMAECSADATLKCTGTAPNLDCNGTCSGSCAVELSAAASCEGTCRGSCTANGSTMDGFEGKCAGECQGECVTEMNAGATCEGKCEGSCEYTPGEAGCEANAEAKCEANADASIECEGTCEGKAEPPEVSAECEASVEAKATASVECRPPQLTIGFQLKADLEGGAAAEAEFRAWVEGFRARFSALLALRAKAQLVVDAAAKLALSADEAVLNAASDLEGNADLKAAVGAGCALEQLPIAAEAIGTSSTQLAGELEAAVQVVAEFQG